MTNRKSYQLAFDLSRKPSYEAEDFLVTSSNNAAHALVTSWPRWSARCLLLLGSTGSGKSHLGTMWASQADAKIVRRAETLDPGEWVRRAPVVFLDDADNAGHAEADLFHLLNLVQEAGGWLLVTACTMPDCWNLSTADVLSRLRAYPTANLSPPDDALLMAVMVKLFTDRQILVDEDVIAYATRRCERSLDAVARFVSAVDTISLEDRRRVTRPLAAEVFAGL